MSKKGKIVCLDVHGVLMHYNMSDGLDGQVIPEGKILAEILRDNGYTIIIQSAETNDDKNRELSKWLTEHSIPFDEIKTLKANANVYVDDRCVHFKPNGDNPFQVLKQIDKRLEEVEKAYGWG